MSTIVNKIVSIFGGVRPMAASLGLPASTVSSWKIRGSIPYCHLSHILRTAREAGLPLTASDLIEDHEPSVMVSAASAATMIGP